MEIYELIKVLTNYPADSEVKVNTDEGVKDISFSVGEDNNSSLPVVYLNLE